MIPLYVFCLYMIFHKQFYGPTASIQYMDVIRFIFLMDLIFVVFLYKYIFFL